MTKIGRHVRPEALPPPWAWPQPRRCTNGFAQRKSSCLAPEAPATTGPTPDVDLMAVCADEAAVRETDETLRQFLEGKYEAPVVNVTTITEAEFRRTAPLGQSCAGQAARHGVTPDVTTGLKVSQNR